MFSLLLQVGAVPIVSTADMDDEGYSEEIITTTTTTLEPHWITTNNNNTTTETQGKGLF